MSEKKDKKNKPSGKPASESSDEEPSCTEDLVSEILSDDGSAFQSPPPNIQGPAPPVAGAEGMVATGGEASGSSKSVFSPLKSAVGWVIKKVSPDKGTKEKSSRKKEKSPGQSKESFFNRLLKKSPKKRTMDNLPESGAASSKKKVSKWESAKMHGGFPDTKGELVLDESESSGGGPTDTSSLGPSSVLQSPIEKAFPDQPIPDKPASREESSDEDTLSEQK